MKRLLLALAMVLAVTALPAQEAGMQFEQANAAYRLGKFAEAAALYNAILKNGYNLPEVYYNLGNCFFKQDDIPGAILAFERAKRLAPNDEDISYNLRLANLRVVDKIEPIPQFFLAKWWSAFVQLLSSDGWAEAGILALWALAVCGALFLLLRSIVIQRLLLAAIAALLVVTVLSFVNMSGQRNAERAENRAIVFAQTVSVKSSPDSQSTDLFVLHEGVKVELLDAVGTWRKIRLADGKIGWLAEEAIQAI